MLIDASHKRWIRVCLLVTAGATATYLPYHLLSLNGPTGGSWPGLIYGILGSALMLFAGLLSWRKKVPTWRIGRAETWMRGHIWLGLLSLPLILFHSGFRFGGALTTALMVLFIVILISGIWGLALQQFLPRMMMMQVPGETIYEQIGHVIDQLQSECDALVEQVCGPVVEGEERLSQSGVSTARVKTEGKVKGKVIKSRVKRQAAQPVPGSEPLKAFYLSHVRPFLEQGPKRGDRLATPQRAAAAFDHLRTILPLELHDTVNDLAAACQERQQLARQAQLHRWLHGWLFVHVPLSMAVLVLAVVHVVMALRY